ncbi:glyceraldehyde-3-phosphate dehydrogenase [Bdellovibrio sp. HCB337]|uniref:glyceraldehyde-3-phosphate dehydrogenase n=1 Tax=Bdellovibrio sp. HCB337 TaxID=3394358 RepID=UPI0039A64BAC
MRLFFIFLSVFLTGTLSRAVSLMDPEDGYLDASNWLLEHHGFIPVPVIITEPAVGYGAGVALLFMQRGQPGHHREEGKFAPPIVTAVAAGATENGTKFAGLVHQRSWDEDHWRYFGAIALTSINLDFYELSDFRQNAPTLEYNLDGGGTAQEIRRRLGESEWFAGLRYLYADITASFAGDYPPFLESAKNRERNGGLAVVANYDGRDNTLSPQDGYQGEFRYYVFDPAFGSDHKYRLAVADLTGFWQFNPTWGAAARLLTKKMSGDPPFYTKPYINLRGIAKMRYQGDLAVSSEGELRWSPHHRWQYSVFGGVGKAVTEGQDYDDASSAGTYGAGFRYLMARLLGFQMGLDLARGPEETVVYIQAGSAWF